MKICNTLKILGFAGVFSLFAACAGSPPTQEMSDARQAIQAAKDAGADKHVPGLLKSSEELIQSAETKLNNKAFRKARKDAIAAKNSAMTANSVATAIKNAAVVLKKAESLGNVWRDSSRMATDAQKAAAEGDVKKALKLANTAKMEGEHAINQYYVELVTYKASKLEDSDSLNPSQKAALGAVKDALNKKDGKKALDLLEKI